MMQILFAEWVRRNLGGAVRAGDARGAEPAPLNLEFEMSPYRFLVVRWFGSRPQGASSLGFREEARQSLIESALHR
jgi:hypothetical protein